jgi:hypothetical protein
MKRHPTDMLFAHATVRREQYWDSLFEVLGTHRPRGCLRLRYVSSLAVQCSYSTVPSVTLVSAECPHCHYLGTYPLSLSTIHYPLSTIHYPLSTVHCPLSTVHCPLSTVHCPLSTIHYPLSTIHYPLSTIHYPLSTIHCPLSTVHCPLSTVHCPLSTVHCPLSTVHLSESSLHRLTTLLGTPTVPNISPRLTSTLTLHSPLSHSLSSPVRVLPCTVHYPLFKRSKFKVHSFRLELTVKLACPLPTFDERKAFHLAIAVIYLYK